MSRKRKFFFSFFTHKNIIIFVLFLIFKLVERGREPTVSRMAVQGVVTDKWKGVIYFFIFVLTTSTSLTVSIMEELSPGNCSE